MPVGAAEGSGVALEAGAALGVVGRAVIGATVESGDGLDVGLSVGSLVGIRVAGVSVGATVGASEDGTAASLPRSNLVAQSPEASLL